MRKISKIVRDDKLVNLFTAPTLASRQEETVQPKNLKFCMVTPLGGRMDANGSGVPIGTLSGNTSGWPIFVPDKFL